MSKILLTGANGYLGSIIYKTLNSDFNIITLGTKKGNITCNLQFEIPNIDEKIETVIHCAGKAHFSPRNENEKKLFHEINVIGTLNLLKSLSNINICPKYFVFISSVSVYGLILGENITESSPLLANDPYGKSKIDAELIIKNWCTKNNVICTILRLPLIVGDNPPGNLGAMIHGIKKRYYFNIAGGNAKKSMVLATDIAQFILQASEKGGTYNLTDGNHPSFNDLSKNIANMLGKSTVPNLPKIMAIILAKVGDLFGNKVPINSFKLSKIISTLTFDDTKARIAFGWNPSSVLDFFKINKDV